MVELSHKRIHGTYIGMSPIAASHGASFEESRIDFSINAGGITMRERIGEGPKARDFQVHYSPEWVFHLKGWGVDKDLALRQDRESDLAQVIFHWRPWWSFARADVITTLGEGIPALIGIFVREKRGAGLLEEIYKKTYEPAKDKNEERRKWLIPVDVESGKATLDTGSLEAKLKLLEETAHNLWSAPDRVVEERLTLIEYALHDPNPRVQIAALEGFTLGARVVGGIEIVTGFLAYQESLNAAVLEKAIEAATCLLHEVHYCTKDRAELVRIFGTATVEEVWDVSGGRITPEQAELLEKVSREVPPQRTWTQEHHRILRQALGNAASRNGNLTERSAQTLQRALTEYALSAA